MKIKNPIAEKRLLFSRKNSALREELVIQIGMPYTIKDGGIEHPITNGAGCSRQFIGLFEDLPDVYGSDAVQALYIASNVDSFLTKLSHKYDFFYLSGEPYFDKGQLGDTDKIIK